MFTCVYTLVIAEVCDVGERLRTDVALVRTRTGVSPLVNLANVRRGERLREWRQLFTLSLAHTGVQRSKYT